MAASLDKLLIRIATTEDHAFAEGIRQAAFDPVFASFENILGKDIYNLAQAAEDNSQGQMLAELFEPDSDWELYIAEFEGNRVGFLALKIDPVSKVGEIGLNAVHPNYTGIGIGTKFYEFAAQKMKDSGMKVATVATGGDPSHAAARSAYRKAGFDTEIPSLWMCKLLQ